MCEYMHSILRQYPAGILSIHIWNKILKQYTGKVAKHCEFECIFVGFLINILTMI